MSNQDTDKYELEPKVKNTKIYDETRESVVDTRHEQCKDWYPQNNNEKSWGYGRINILFEAEREAGCG